jgi:hypothetical protein
MDPSKNINPHLFIRISISEACYMLGDYALATEWLDMSDKDNMLPVSDAMRKRINARKAAE